VWIFAQAVRDADYNILTQDGVTAFLTHVMAQLQSVNAIVDDEEGNS
jgi:hypothetical protein